MDQVQITDIDQESIGHAILASMRLNANVQCEPELVRSDFTLCGHSLSVSRLSVKSKENIKEKVLILDLGTCLYCIIIRWQQPRVAVYMPPFIFGGLENKTPGNGDFT